MKMTEKSLKPLCKYGENCYQKNPNHFNKFRHPNKDCSNNDDEILSRPPLKKPKTEVSDNIKESEIESPDDTQDVDEDDIILTINPEKIEERIKQCFLVDMPKDFYDFWDFCSSINQMKPEEALSEVGLRLVGPYDLVSGKIKCVKGMSRNKFLCHWRYFYDPPEFQTVLAGEEGFHIGYFRDHPTDRPVFLACSSPAASRGSPGTLDALKEDIFASLFAYVGSAWCKAGEKTKEGFRARVERFASSKGYAVASGGGPSPRLKERNRRVVAKSFHRAGIVVPVDKETDVGYREVPETDANLKKMLRKISEAKTPDQRDAYFEPIHELMTNAQWATDEGDFGMALELGIDFFIFGCEDLHSCISHLLCVAYDLLQREPFALILKAHLKNRRKGNSMSSFD